MTTRWQYSTRNLLVWTTIASLVLLIAVKWPSVVLPVFVLICCWLVYPVAIVCLEAMTSTKWPWIAMVLWMLMGAMLMRVAVFVWKNIPAGASSVGTAADQLIEGTLSIVIGCVGLICCYRAWRAVANAGR